MIFNVAFRMTAQIRIGQNNNCHTERKKKK